MALLVMLLALGYLCARLKLVGPEFNKGLSKLVINVFLAGMILSSVINKKLEMTGGDVAFGLLMMTLSMLICVGIGWLSPTLLRIKDGDKGMYRILAAFMNNGFMGFPLVAAVYGENTVFFASLSNIPFNLLLNTVGVCFFFAQKYHTSMRYVGTIRKELGFRTVFNILGPLTNPGSPSMQLLGVYDEYLVGPLAQVLISLGVKRGMVVYGQDKLDEISLSAPTTVCEIRDGWFKSYVITPEDFIFSFPFSPNSAMIASDTDIQLKCFIR